jgi:hypothetical protein
VIPCPTCGSEECWCPSDLNGPCSQCGALSGVECKPGCPTSDDPDSDPFCPRCGEQLFGFEMGPLCDNCTYRNADGDDYVFTDDE